MRAFEIVAVCAAALCGLVMPVHGQESAVAIEVASAVGHASMNDELTPNEVRRRALNSAFSDAIAQAMGRRVASMVEYSTEERGASVQERFSRLIRELSSGVVTQHTVLNERWEDPPDGSVNRRYRVEIKALVRRDPSAGLTPFDLSVATTGARFTARPSVEQSDEVVLKVRSGADAWLTVFLVTDDSVEVLFPNQFVPNLRIAHDVPVEVPSVQQRRVMGLRLRAALPEGSASRSERITVVATRDPVRFAGPTVRDKSDVYRVPTIRDTFDALAKWLLAIPPNDRAVADVLYEVVRGGNTP